jgi:uncharacterized protein YjiS (DUF1127 family)
MTSAALNATLSGERRRKTVAHLFNSARQTLAAWRRRRRTFRALTELDDHILKDIGLHRSEILSVAHHSLTSKHAKWRD